MIKNLHGLDCGNCSREKHYDKLDNKFPQFLKAWATNILHQEELIPKEVLALHIFYYVGILLGTSKRRQQN